MEWVITKRDKGTGKGKRESEIRMEGDSMKSQQSLKLYRNAF